MGLEKAYLEIDGGDGPIDCYFNPTEYSIAKANTWEAIKVNGKPSPDRRAKIRIVDRCRITGAKIFHGVS